MRLSDVMELLKRFHCCCIIVLAINFYYLLSLGSVKHFTEWERGKEHKNDRKRMEKKENERNWRRTIINADDFRKSVWLSRLGFNHNLYHFPWIFFIAIVLLQEKEEKNLLSVRYAMRNYNPPFTHLVQIKHKFVHNIEEIFHLFRFRIALWNEWDLPCNRCRHFSLQ